MHHFAVSKNAPSIEEALFRENLRGLTTKRSPWISSRFICLPRVTIHYRLLDEGLVSLTRIMVNSHRHFKILVASVSVLIRAYLSLLSLVTVGRAHTIPVTSRMETRLLFRGYCLRPVGEKP